MNEYIPITLASIGMMGMLCQWMAWTFKVPSILFLILLGMALGPFTGFLQPDEMFGDLLPPFVSFSVAIILFEGALTLKFHELEKTARVMTTLVSAGLVVTWLGSSFAAHYFLDYGWPFALLLGAIISVSGPTVILPIIRSVRPRPEVANILKWEGIVIDPIGAMLALLVFEYFNIQDHFILPIIGKLIVTGTFGAFILTGIVAFIMRHHVLPAHLMKVSILMLVITIFALCDMVQHDSGLLAVTLAGILLANKKDLALNELLDFKESISVILISCLFIILPARLELEPILAVLPGAGILLAFVTFVVRPVAVMLATVRTTLNWREKLFLSWIYPRGIVAASVASLFSIYISNGNPNFDRVDDLAPMVLLIIVGTVLLQSLTATPLASFLKINEKNREGVLVVGINTVTLALGKALKELNFPVLLVDSDWEKVRNARMEGLKTYLGNIMSEHADRNLDLFGIGRMIALSHQPSINILACMRFKNEFGANNVYSGRTTEEKEALERENLAQDFKPNYLFSEDLTLAKFSSLLSQGYKVSKTNITENFPYEEYKKIYGENSYPLFVVTPNQRLIPYQASKDFLPPKKDGAIISLVPPREDKEQKDATATPKD